MNSLSRSKSPTVRQITSPTGKQITLYNMDLPKNQPQQSIWVQPNTTICDLMNCLRKKHTNNEEIQLLFSPNESFKSSLDTFLYPILQEKNIRTIYYRKSTKSNTDPNSGRILSQEYIQPINQYEYRNVIKADVKTSYSNNRNNNQGASLSSQWSSQQNPYNQSMQQMKIEQQNQGQFQQQSAQQELPSHNVKILEIHSSSQYQTNQQQILELKQENLNLQKVLTFEKEQNLELQKQFFQQCKSSEEQIKQLQQQLQQQKNQQQSYINYLEQIISKNEDFKSLKENLNTQLDMERVEKEGLIKNINESKQNIIKLNNLIENYEQNIKQHEEEKDKMQQKYSNLSREVTNLRQKNVSLQESNKDLKNELKSVRYEMEQCKKQNEDIKKQLKSFDQLTQQDFNKICFQKEYFMKKNSIQTENCKYQEKQFDDLINEYSQLKTEKMQMEQTINEKKDLEKQRDALQQQYKELQGFQEQQNSKSLNTINSLKIDIKVYVEKIQQQENQMQEMNNKLKMIEQERQSLIQQLNDLKKEQIDQTNSKGQQLQNNQRTRSASPILQSVYEKKQSIIPPRCSLELTFKDILSQNSVKSPQYSLLTKLYPFDTASAEKQQYPSQTFQNSAQNYNQIESTLPEPQSRNRVKILSYNFK